MPAPDGANNFAAMTVEGDTRIASRRVRPELAEAGDWIEVEGTGGAGPRRGEIREVLGIGRHLHFLVSWADEHESLFYPSERGCIVHQPAQRRPA